MDAGGGQGKPEPPSRFTCKNPTVGRADRGKFVICLARGRHLRGQCWQKILARKNLTMTWTEHQWKGTNLVSKSRKMKWKRSGKKWFEQSSWLSFDYQAEEATFLSVSSSTPFSPSLLLVLSISAHDLAGAAESRLNCAISYMFTFLTSFWAYFPPNISPRIILHFLYNDMLSLISSL